MTVLATLLHDAPEYAPAGIDLDPLLSSRFGSPVTAVVRALQRGHEALAGRAALDLTAVGSTWKKRLSGSGWCGGPTGQLTATATRWTLTLCWNATSEVPELAE